MKQISTKYNSFKMAALVALTTLVTSAVTLAPAQAQDRRDRNKIRYDTIALRRDQAHLRDLQHRRNVLKSRHDWKGVHRLDVAITDTQWRINHKRYDLHHDFDRFYSDSDRDWFYHHAR